MSVAERDTGTYPLIPIVILAGKNHLQFIHLYSNEFFFDHHSFKY